MGITASPALTEAVRRALEARPEVREAYVFGSLARGDAAAHSDVDVAIWVDEARAAEPASGFGLEADVAADLMRALGRNDVDVVRLDRASPLLYHRVLRDGIRVLARDLRETTVREGRALSRWCDWAPTQARIDAQLTERRRERAGE